MNTKNITVTDKPLLNTNLDTNFLKLVAIISMFIDHVGAAFFPEYPVFRWLGRLAFPIFCYCMTVGMLYTSNIRRYLGRLGLFAVISQPFWILAFNPQDILGNLTNWNIFFTLFISLLAVWGFKEKNGGFSSLPSWLYLCGILIIPAQVSFLCWFSISAGKTFPRRRPVCTALSSGLFYGIAGRSSESDYRKLRHRL